jgi:hypothetical protein
MTIKKIIPISQLPTDRLEEIDALQDRLEQAGYMRMMQIGEPRLSELATKYKAKGYEVEVVPYVDDGDPDPNPSSGGCGPGSCSAGASSTGSVGGCASGGCGSASSATNGSASGTSVRSAQTRTIVPGVGTIYVRMPARSAQEHPVP